ncbi:hypothetical protein [Maribellus maritimus]|uniref:hypothetical protein n=1 Tax=Maribellus maritimus TaxID=2870838 RepID=UPI001EEC3584|nr:hypothetical protein [Maribellus maritimus]MCG6186561.1 hypothetical protein [Maribellus maritimus]
MKIRMPAKLMSEEAGFGFIVELYEQTKNMGFDDLELDFKSTYWLEANLCAALGAILSRLQEEFVSVNFVNVNPSVELILSKNHFLSNFGSVVLPDTHQTTIKFRKFKVTEEKAFKDYLDKELLSQPDLPSMSPLLKSKINKSIFEIFNNANIHGHCSHVFSCGQYFPQKKRLAFTVADLGKSIKSNVNHYLNKSLSGSEAISWAVEEGNTTRTGTIPGGLGLSLIRDFLKLNKGYIQIVSSNGYWEERKGVIFATEFDNTLLGTIVNLDININDHSSYVLSSEINADSIF